MRITLAVIALLAAAAAPAVAQQSAGNPLVGSWSGQRPSQGGMDRITDLYQPDGSFVSVLQLPNGTIQRMWGMYRLAPAGPGQFRIDFQLQGHLPLQICAQAPGSPMSCRPNDVPQSVSGMVTMTSPASFQVNGIMMARDDAAPLLRAAVPQQLVLGIPAPVQPQMRQPVMPTLHPYQTPNGPGNAIAGANHAGAQDFVNGYMRGCYKGTDGRLYGCQQ